MNEKEFYKERLLNNDNYKVFLADTPHIKRGNISSTGFNNENLKETLKNEYPIIFKSICDEDFFIPDNEKFFYLYEICEGTEIIGFASFTIYTKASICMNQIYVLPEYRGQKHFVKTYNHFCNLLPECDIYIHNPNHTIINNIKELNFGTVINNRFLISKIMFVTDQVSFEDSLTYTNKTFHESGKTIKYQTESNLYDLKLDAVIKLSANNKVYTGKEDLLLLERSNISLIREEDELKHNLLQKRCDDSWIENGNYFKKINKILKKNMITINR